MPGTVLSALQLHCPFREPLVTHGHEARGMRLVQTERATGVKYTPDSKDSEQKITNVKYLINNFNYTLK